MKSNDSCIGYISAGPHSELEFGHKDSRKMALT